MATAKSAQNPYQWPDGSWHSIPAAQHQADQASAPVNGWNPQWLLANAPTGTVIPGAGTATGPPATGTTPQPYDPSTDEAAITGGRNIALGNADAAYQQDNLNFDYGYRVDPTTGQLVADASNPYSRAAMYQLAHDNSARGNTNSFAAQGQLYSGALTNAQSLNDQALTRNDAANKLAYQRATHGVQTGQLTTAANAGTAVSGTDFNALLKATYPTSS